MKKVMIIDARFKDVAKNAWGDEYEIIPTPKTCASEPICYHADVGIVNVCGNILCSPECFSYYKKELSPFGIFVGSGEQSPKSNYPEDLAYNIATTKNAAIFKKGAADKAAIELIRENNLKEIYVNQGYAKCSCVCLPDAIITQDKSIYDALKKEGIECLKISEGGVRLSPFEYGFLGGASGFFRDTVYFFGDITEHRDYDAIKNFLTKRKIGINYIKNYPLTDIGTIFFPY